VKYIADLNRRLKLTELRLKGTNLFTIDEIKPVLESQEANILGIIPLFGYGRGFTNDALLEEDAATIRSLLRQLGYRDATVRVIQGVSPDGENLIITFNVNEGLPTVIGNVEITGNKAFTDAEIKSQFSPLEGRKFSRALLINTRRKILEFYQSRGFYDASVSLKFDEPQAQSQNTQNQSSQGNSDSSGQNQQNQQNPKEKIINVTFQIENEGKPVYINRVLVTGNEKTKEAAIKRAINLTPGDLLRSSDIYSSEQNLYETDVFENVNTRVVPAQNRPDGSSNRDVIVSVKEQPSRILSYGGGYSTDLGFSSFADIRLLNLFGNLWQGGARFRYSQRQQLAQFDFINPRFLRDGPKRFAPFTLSISYQRDETVTRFFRTAFDRGTFGIVQRLDQNGNPVDEIGNLAGSPTLNRFTVSAESNRTLDLKTRSLIFFRYRFEDVRLFNIESLLIKDLLQPDAKIRISGFGFTFVRDTRENCSRKYSILDIIARGEIENPCVYDSANPTRGTYITAEYNVSLPPLGANIGFNKFQASFNGYYSWGKLSKVTFAARGVLGLANVFAKGNRFSTTFPELGSVLPISERFFAGGSNTLRGFDFEGAGPRVAVVPTGQFFNSKGEQIFLTPFTVPFGGNALAIVNLEARIPFGENFRLVPFYDGGNVFRSIRDFVNPPDAIPSDVFRRNLRSLWSHTIGLGLRFKTPIGGEIGFDYGYLLNPPTFIIPQPIPPDAVYRLHQGQVHFRFSQAF
ncbi:MAG TPA: BamA/TamA family outer membrane protein, partial [Pyrinomonadaceae bacterium]|nr:BamA/TamA family outer membrane protein [Pyrinomonadaceae bacterium]